MEKKLGHFSIDLMVNVSYYESSSFPIPTVRYQAM
jgi:hypothetical protein